jgi:hypothetical protein
MDFPPAQKLSSEAGGRRVGGWLAVLALVFYGLILAFHVGAVAGGSDSSGYMNHARLLASDRLHVPPRIIPGLPQSEAPPFLYVPLGFKPALNGDGLVPTYPSGFALFVLAFKPIAGWRHAGDVTIVLHSLAGVLATYGLGRLAGLRRRWAVLGAGIIAASPLYIWSSLQAMTDVPSLAWTAAALLAALKSRNHAAWALAAGAAMAVDVLIRPTNVLAFLPVCVALGLSPKRWLFLVAGGLPGAVFFAAHSLAAYGSIFATGYGDNSLDFGSRFITGTLLHYGRWIPALFTPIVVLVLLLPWAAEARPRIRWVLGIWILAFAAFYSCYICTHQTWWYLRFLLPAAPAFVVGSLLVLQGALRRFLPRSDAEYSWAPWAALALFTAGYSGWWSHRLHALSIGQSELRYGQVADWLQANLPPDSVCLAMQASGSLFYYTHFVFIRWDALEPDNVARVDTAIRKSERPLYAVLFPFERDESGALQHRMPGHWTEIKRIEDVTVWKRDFGAAKP